MNMLFKHKTYHELSPWFRVFRNRIAKQIHLDLSYSLEDLAAESRPILHIHSHHSASSWLASLAAIISHYCENGLGHRVPAGVFDHALRHQDDYRNALTAGKIHDLTVNFSNPAKFIELALESKATICLYTSMSNPQRKRKIRKIEKLGVQSVIYTPELTLEQLSQDKNERKLQLNQEAELIRGKIRCMADDLHKKYAASSDLTSEFDGTDQFE